jgi:hypothetical protein
MTDMLKALLREAGTRLDPTTREQMEGSFSCDFSDVVIHTSSLSHAFNARLGTLAVATGDHVCFSRGAYDPASEFGRVLLAHELAHVVQQRLSSHHRCCTDALTRQAAEIEADAAAWAVVQGRRATCTISLPRGTLSAWGPAGHYYTVYYVLLAAGLDNDRACRLAFFAQLPDQVHELDAVSQGMAFGKRGVKDIIRVNTGGGFDLERFEAARRQSRDIQLGLHCLTGRKSQVETASRRHIILNQCRNQDEAGLAFHSFGDSFAHRKLGNEGVMYHWPTGHLPDGHGPDEINRRPALYRVYMLEMFDLACSKWQGLSRRVVESQRLVTAAQEVSSGQSEKLHIQKLRELSAQIGVTMKNYAPEAESKRRFEEFIKFHAVPQGFLARAYDLARSWSTVTVNPPAAPSSPRMDQVPVPPGTPTSIPEIFKGMPRR